MPKQKKELKDHINKNGGFIHMKLNTLEKNAPEEFEGMIPKGAMYFEGIASNGDLNRNGYIIRPSAWVSAIDSFLETGQVLFQHDQENPIGTPLDAEVNEEGELFVKGYVFDTEEYTQNRISKGLVRGLST